MIGRPITREDLEAITRLIEANEQQRCDIKTLEREKAMLEARIGALEDALKASKSTRVYSGHGCAFIVSGEDVSMLTLTDGTLYVEKLKEATDGTFLIK